MVMRFPEPHEIESRRRELEQKIADGEKAKEDLAKLYEWVKMGDALIPVGKATAGKPKIERYALNLRTGRKTSPLSSYAEKVLTRSGKLHITVLMAQMRKDGWVSTGEDPADQKNIYNTLAVNKKFVNLGRNIWDMRERYPDLG
jgi:hypothetical protein